MQVCLNTQHYVKDCPKRPNARKNKDKLPKRHYGYTNKHSGNYHSLQRKPGASATVEGDRPTHRTKNHRQQGLHVNIETCRRLWRGPNISHQDHKPTVMD